MPGPSLLSPLDSPDHDPVMTQFDRLVAFVCYVLLFSGVFTLGLSSVVALALAMAHQNDTHFIIRSHYRHQIRIFSVGALCITGAVLAGFAGTGVWLAALIGWVEQMTGLHAADLGVTASVKQGWIGGVMLGLAIALIIFGVGWTLLQSLFGFLRLAGNRGIGHTARA